jgi:hypothetical protein
MSDNQNPLLGTDYKIDLSKESGSAFVRAWLGTSTKENNMNSTDTWIPAPLMEYMVQAVKNGDYVSQNIVQYHRIETQIEEDLAKAYEAVLAARAEEKRRRREAIGLPPEPFGGSRQPSPEPLEPPYSRGQFRQP